MCSVMSYCTRTATLLYLQGSGTIHFTHCQNIITGFKCEHHFYKADWDFFFFYIIEMFYQGTSAWNHWLLSCDDQSINLLKQGSPKWRSESLQGGPNLNKAMTIKIVLWSNLVVSDVARNHDFFWRRSVVLNWFNVRRTHHQPRMTNKNFISLKSYVKSCFIHSNFIE